MSSNKNISKSIKTVLLVFLVFFIAIISYINYLYLFKSDKYIESAFNNRQRAEKNKVLRGTIFDRDMNALTKGEKTGEFEQTREYLGGQKFAHVLGYYDTVYGMSGLEKKFDKVLSGKENKPIKDYFNFNSNETRVGDSIVTTLDSKLQVSAFDALGDFKGSVVALEPSTGEVLAMVSKPTFNPNNLAEQWDALSKDEETPFLNRATAGLYPPGSTFKAVTALAALEHMPGVENRTFEDNGRINFNDSTSLENYNGNAFGSINLQQAFTHSSNVVFGTLAMEMGNDALKSTAEKFYFNKEIPSRTLVLEDSKFPTYKKYEVGNIAQSGIGQSGVLASPMQMALVASTIANNGVMMEPNIVKEIINAQGQTVSKIEPKEIGTVVSTENATILKQYMRSVVTEGTAQNVNLWGVQVSGKTGTADHDSGDKIAHSWFIGFAPAENPKIAFAIILEEGAGQGKNAADVAKDILSDYFNQ
ncbi:MAG: penicillin-binding protein 2 [Clostridium argentinense]|uniref:Penicillin-binding protein 2 n=1 Tax=Clostridium faecium TaxID=2762223 RepID=A0ABR8YTX7_9CLOT|nr:MULTISPECIES: penicillin-binding protein 2 [Clostridium]MBD8047701.1 penicillin-binding protein 2 [Clostridium faecium]MBS5823342.1 penicillin-binding protein 2 [Clostridium argentinense]MDU1348045.1 penicillin-binding protein 2 [Clostridium argentinense]